MNTNNANKQNKYKSVPQNVVRHRASTIYHNILDYLEEHMSISKNTKITYETTYKHFFNYMKNKELNELTIEDLQFKKSDIMHYKNHLIKTYSNTSVNQKISHLKALYLYLKSIDYEVNPNIFDLRRLPEYDAKKRGTLHWEEVDQMTRLVKKQRKGLEKSLLIELAAKTSIRLDALLNLTWNNFEKMNGVYAIRTVDKGKENIKAIYPEHYERLSKIKKSYTNKVFSLTHKTVHKMMKQLVEEMDISDRRNITFHSLKKCGIEEAHILSNGDIKQMAQQGNNSEHIVLKNYAELENDPSKLICLQIGKDIDLEPLKQLTKEELISIIEESDRATQIKLLDKIQR